LVLEENENLLITKIDKPENLYFFDTEKNNPRLDNDSQITDFVRYIVDTEDSKEFSRRVESYGLNYLELTKNKLNEKSHGEIILPMLKDLENLKNSLILLDEPESSLSIRSVYKFIKILRKLEENGNQVLIATHSPIIIEEFGKVYSLDTREWIESDTFVDRMKSY
jgi:predicted ATPase